MTRERRVTPHLRWLVPIGYAGLCVLEWISAVNADDGTGLAFIGVWLLAMPWSLAVVVLGTERSGSFLVVIVGGVVNTAILGAWAIDVLSHRLRWAIATGIAALVVAAVLG